MDIMTVSSASNFLMVRNGSLLGPKSTAAMVALVTVSAANPTILIVIFFSECCIWWNSVYNVHCIAVNVTLVHLLSHSNRLQQQLSLTRVLQFG